MLLIPFVLITGNKMKRLDLGKIGTIKGKLHQILEMSKSYIISSFIHGKCEANSTSECFNDWKMNSAYLAQMEIIKAEGAAIFEKQKNRLIN
jgi:hypothetical protein